MQLTKHNKSDWYFIPTTLSGTVGIVIGVFIANLIGWV